MINQPIKRKRRVWPWVLGASAFIILVCLLGTVLVAGNASEDATPPSAGAVGKGSATPDPHRTMFSGKGMFKIGAADQAKRLKEGGAAPGRYFTPGAKKGPLPYCYYHSAADDTDDTIDQQGILTAVDQPAYITLKPGQWFKTDGCQDWTLQK